MGQIDLSPLKDSLDNIASQLIILSITCAIAYVVVFFIFRMFRAPKQLANFLASIALLVVLYYSFVHGYIPSIQGTQ